jgi:hypothetical protein
VNETAAQRLQRLRRTDSHTKAARVRATLDATVTTGGPFSVSQIARTAGVSRRFIYDHPELRAEIELKAAESVHRFTAGLTSSARISAASIRADHENTKAENQRLRQRIRSLETRLSEVLGAEVAAELTGHGVLASETSLREQNDALQAKVGQLTDDLRHKDEDLDAARQANRELMAELNRPRPRS